MKKQMKHSDYIYKTENGNIRVFKKHDYETDKFMGWDYDFIENGEIKTYTVEGACSAFKTKKELLSTVIRYENYNPSGDWTI